MPQTPLEKLDLAIEEFLREIGSLAEGGFLTGWALGMSTSRVQADNDSCLPMVSGAQYTFGPQTSIIQLAGLAKYLTVVAEKATWEQLTDPNDAPDWT